MTTIDDDRPTDENDRVTAPEVGLFVTDAELIRWIGVPEKKARVQLRELDRKASGFPRKQKSWGDRRYWPAVQAWFDRYCGLIGERAQQQAEHRPHRPPAKRVRTPPKPRTP